MKGIIHIPILIAIVAVLAVVASVSAIGSAPEQFRRFDLFCKFYPRSPVCTLEWCKGKLAKGLIYPCVSPLPRPLANASPKPTPNPSQVPSPLPNKISWQTPYASLEADNFYITADDKTFLGNVPKTRLLSDPGTTTYQTLEVEWTENDFPMRFYVYFFANSDSWGVSEVRTYNGQSQGSWIYYRGLGIVAKLGSTFTNNLLDIKSDPNNSSNQYTGSIHFENLKLQAFLTQQPGNCNQKPRFTLSKTQAQPSEEVVATISNPGGCNDNNKAAILNSTTGSREPGECTFTNGASECQIKLKAPPNSGTYSYQAGIDIDGNGTIDVWSQWGEPNTTLYVN